MHDEIYDYMNSDEDICYTWPVGNDDVVVQWDMMARDGIINLEQAARMMAADKVASIASLARRHPSRMNPINRLKFMRTLTLHGVTEADLATARPSRSFAQRMIDYAQPGAGA